MVSGEGSREWRVESGDWGVVSGGGIRDWGLVTGDWGLVGLMN